jgi:hypothetical protein
MRRSLRGRAREFPWYHGPGSPARIEGGVTEGNGSKLVWGTSKSYERRSVPTPRSILDELATHLISWTRFGSRRCKRGRIAVLGSARPPRSRVGLLTHATVVAGCGWRGLHRHRRRSAT